MQTETVAAFYARARRFGYPARDALEYARRSAKRGEPKPGTPHPTQNGRAYSPDWSPRTHWRWIEKPRAVGLRFAGYADALAKIGHRGWYIDDFYSETARGVVFLLPNGRAVYGVQDPHNGSADNDGPCLICVSDVCDVEKYGLAQIACWADRSAEMYAELERDQQQADSEARAAFSEANEARDECRNALESLRAARQASDPTGIETYCDEFRDAWETYRDAFRRALGMLGGRFEINYSDVAERL